MYVYCRLHQIMRKKSKNVSFRIRYVPSKPICINAVEYVYCYYIMTLLCPYNMQIENEPFLCSDGKLENHMRFNGKQKVNGNSFLTYKRKLGSWNVSMHVFTSTLQHLVCIKISSTFCKEFVAVFLFKCYFFFVKRRPCSQVLFMWNLVIRKIDFRSVRFVDMV